MLLLNFKKLTILWTRSKYCRLFILSMHNDDKSSYYTFSKAKKRNKIANINMVGKYNVFYCAFYNDDLAIRFQNNFQYVYRKGKYMSLRFTIL